MAQHDYVIDNSTGANVRADINNALLAISSNNSGSSAPSTTYGLQSFANTTDSMLQLRNAANNAFVNLRKFDGSLPLPDGSVSSPSLFLDDDTNTGLFSSAADTLNFTTGGVERMELGATTIFNEDGADVDFRIEGNTDANLFHVDAGNDRIGISTSTPDSLFHVFAGSAGSISAAGSAVITLEKNGDTALQFLSPSSNVQEIRFGDESDNGSGYIQYSHASNFLAFGLNGGSERMRITSSGSVGIGTTSPETNLHVQGAGDGMVRITSADGSSAFLDLGDASDKDGGRIQYNTDSSLRFHTASTERLRIDSSGTVYVGGASASATAGTLFFNDTSANGSKIQQVNGSSALSFHTGSSQPERMRLNSSGRLIVGTSTASSAGNSQYSLFEVSGNTSASTGVAHLTLKKGQTSANCVDGNSLGRLIFSSLDGGDFAFIQVSVDGSPSGSDFPASMRFHTCGDGASSASERMRINSSGFFQYNNTTDIGGIFQLTANGVTNLSGNKLARFNFNSTGDVTGIEMRHARGGLSGFSGKMISFTGNDGTEEGSVAINVTSTTYNTSSDYRLKENETAISDGITKLKQLKPYRFNFKKDPDVKVEGFFAHEVSSVVPNAVTGEKDAMKPETRYVESDTIPSGKVIGDPKTFSTTEIDPQQIDHSKLVPILVAAVQELIGKVEALEAA